MPESEESEPSELAMASTPQKTGSQSPPSDTTTVDDSDVSQATDERPLAAEFTVGTGNGSSFTLGGH